MPPNRGADLIVSQPHIDKCRGFTLFEVLVVIFILSVVSLVGVASTRQYAIISEAKKTEADVKIIMSAMKDRWMETNGCTAAIPTGAPTMSRYWTTFSAICYQNGFGVAVNVPAEIADRLNQPNQVVTVINASTKRVSISATAPFISDGGFEKRRVYGE